MLRQVLMCNVDTGVLGQVWADKEQPAAFPDFNTRHKVSEHAGLLAAQRLTVLAPV
jgi:hypothetical protein